MEMRSKQRLVFVVIFVFISAVFVFFEWQVATQQNLMSSGRRGYREIHSDGPLGNYGGGNASIDGVQVTDYLPTFNGRPYNLVYFRPTFLSDSKVYYYMQPDALAAQPKCAQAGFIGVLHKLPDCPDFKSMPETVKLGEDSLLSALGMDATLYVAFLIFLTFIWRKYLIS